MSHSVSCVCSCCREWCSRGSSPFPLIFFVRRWVSSFWICRACPFCFLFLGRVPWGSCSFRGRIVCYRVQVWSFWGLSAVPACRNREACVRGRIWAIACIIWVCIFGASASLLSTQSTYQHCEQRNCEAPAFLRYLLQRSPPDQVAHVVHAHTDPAR